MEEELIRDLSELSEYEKMQLQNIQLTKNSSQ